MKNFGSMLNDTQAKYFGPYQIWEHGIVRLLTGCDKNDIVWEGSDNSMVVGDIATVLDELDTTVEYVEMGTVASYLGGD